MIVNLVFWFNFINMLNIFNTNEHPKSRAEQADGLVKVEKL